MPRTDPAPLSIPLRRANARAFCLVASVPVAAAAWWVSTAVNATPTWAWAAALVLPLVALVSWPARCEDGIRAWNKVTRVGARWLAAYVVRVCYYVLFVAVARTRSDVDLRHTGVGSRWIARDAITQGGEWRGLHGALLGCAKRNGHTWMILLLPVAWLLAALRTEEQEHALPFSTYTLF